MRIVVIGGGITGQLVKHAFPYAEVYDWGKTGRLIRSFGTNYLHEPLTGIRCRQFAVYTHIDGRPATEESAARYKRKVNKAYELVDHELLSRQFPDVSVGYDLDEPLTGLVTYGMRAVEINATRKTVFWSNGMQTPYDLLVSTIPLYHLLKLTGGHDGVLQAFRYRPIYVKVMQRPPDAPFPKADLYVNYLSDPTVEAYRFCDRGEDRHYEGLSRMGTLPTLQIVPGKIHPLPEQMRFEILELLRQNHIRCFGRFARWAPEELVHETWKTILSFKKEIGS